MVLYSGNHKYLAWLGGKTMVLISAFPSLVAHFRPPVHVWYRAYGLNQRNPRFMIMLALCVAKGYFPGAQLVALSEV